MRSLVLATLFFTSPLFADSSVWKGEVNADGTPTTTVNLELEKKYKIKVSGAVNLGKKWHKGEPLSDDACYEFVAETGKETAQLDNFQNSLGLIVCKTGYHKDHIYISEVFPAKRNKIHFWIDDTDYSDNTGSLQIEIIQVDDK